MDASSAGSCQGVCFPKVDLSTHPCYSRAAHFRFGRIHVPVAPRCNIQCNYCIRKYACPNENRPGVTMRVMSPDEALHTVRHAIAHDLRLRVLGVAGPGDALANQATLTTFERARAEFPHLIRCLSTNGLLLPDQIDAIERAGITTLTITINAVDPAIGKQIYAHVRYRGKTYRGREASTLLLHNQLIGLREAALRGIVVKVNSVLIPGINDHHLIDVACVVKDHGASIMNIIPLIPLAKFAHLPEPSPELLNRVRDECATVIEQFRHCQRCRADAIGVPGEEGCGTGERVCIPRFLAQRKEHTHAVQVQSDPA
ncbi:radical SAM protein [Roseiflexus castenholzii]|uniref:FeMo cofactor biosynthesis protein NifB n=1 Tax=Roseiflexus castenholzii (strain DSM 13941 / HLO8) TaxID=383372 RepID=A7NR79_ROSCS|nr:radical SAM protein [Roseiflexus castenholzii]ABU60075.1 Radical SAM domain protein [Roseiflexus castenholzii DSM 13941]